MREDIIGIIKNAIAHGSTAQQAADSLVNSGYNQKEVNDALRQINSGTLTSLDSSKTQNSQKQNLQISTPQKQTMSPKKQIPQSQKPLVKTLPKIAPNQIYQPKKETKGKFKTLILFTMLLLLTLILVVTIFFKDEILEFLGL